MTSRTASRLLVWALATGCGGSLVPGDSVDGGTHGSAGSGGASTGTGSGGSAGSGGSTGGSDWGACSGPGQCTAALTGCCGRCAMTEIADFAGVNGSYLDAFHAETCPAPVPCPKCATLPNPYIGARCEGARCKPFDVRTVPELTKCGADADCRLRKGLDCCECGATGPWTAVSISGDGPLRDAVCPINSGCLLCAPVPPFGAKAVCTNGHCEVAVEGAPCALPPKNGCCFDDSQCAGRCYGGTCAAGSEGVCKGILPPSGSCWADKDCPIGQACIGAQICPCGAACIVADEPGHCR